MTSQLELGGLGEPEDGDEPKVVVEKDLDVLAQGWTVYWTRSIKALFFESWFNLCMLAAPPAAYYYYTDVDGNNAASTFGNVTELVVSLIALHRGLLRIVQVSLLGSILS